MRAVDPGDGGRRHAEIQMIGHGIGVARLRLGTAALLLDLAKSGFNFPPRAIIFNNLRDGEVQVRGDQGDPLGRAEDPHHAHPAPQGLEHHHTVDRHDRAQLAIQVQRIRLRIRPQRGGQRLREKRGQAQL